MPMGFQIKPLKVIHFGVPLFFVFVSTKRGLDPNYLLPTGSPGPASVGRSSRARWTLCLGSRVPIPIFCHSWFMGEKEEVPLKPIKSREMPTVCGKESSLSLTGSDALSKAESDMLIALDRDMLERALGPKVVFGHSARLGIRMHGPKSRWLHGGPVPATSLRLSEARFVCFAPESVPLSRLALAFYIGNLAQPRKHDAHKKGTVDPSQHCKSTNIQPPNPVKL